MERAVRMAGAYEDQRDMRIVVKSVEAYKAAIKKDWEAFKKYCEDDSLSTNFPMTLAGNTALHIAVHSGDVKLVRALIGLTPVPGPNERGDTVLHEAAAAGNVDMAKCLIEYDTELPETKNKRGETPLFRAAAFNNTKMVRFLASKADMSIHRTRNDGKSILHMTVLSKYFDTALELVKKDSSLVHRRDVNGMTCFHLLSNMPSAFKSGNPMNLLEELIYRCLPDDGNDSNNKCQATSRQRKDIEGGCGRSYPRQHFTNFNGVCTAISNIFSTVWRCISQGLPPIKRLGDIKKQHNRVLQLAKILHVADDTWMGTNPGWAGKPENKDERSQAAPTFEPPIISAARNGIIEIVNLILDEYPMATEVINDREENIFHVAARCRRKEILDRLEGLPPQLLRIGRKINIDGDSILHQAAYQDKHQLRDRPGEALHMQSEIQWFKRVQKLVPPYFFHHKNKNNKTAEELFTIQHEELVKKGQAWLMRTTKACTIVAVLIATVAFTCAYTIPGGSNSKTGHPLLLEETAFRTFTISDTISLCFSLTSVVVFLSIMTSRMQAKDFRRSLPFKLVLGLTTLFFAVAAMMVAFAATLVLLIRQRLHWAAVPIYTIACWPVTIFLVLQFGLYLNITWFTVSDLMRSFQRTFIDSGH